MWSWSSNISKVQQKVSCMHTHIWEMCSSHEYCLLIRNLLTRKSALIGYQLLTVYLNLLYKLQEHCSSERLLYHKKDRLSIIIGFTAISLARQRDCTSNSASTQKHTSPSWLSKSTTLIIRGEHPIVPRMKSFFVKA